LAARVNSFKCSKKRILIPHAKTFLESLKVFKP
jgi:hypothetical protein